MSYDNENIIPQVEKRLKSKIQATEGHGENEEHRAIQDILCGPQFILCGPLWAMDFHQTSTDIGNKYTRGEKRLKSKIQATEGHGENEEHRAIQDILCSK
jgi:hypothetical protein